MIAKVDRCEIYKVGKFARKMNKREKSKSDNETSDVLSGCICPEKCLLNKPIDLKKPADAQKVLCTNSKCNQILFIHRTCFDNWEKILVDSMLKSRRTRGRDWTDSQWYHNLWLKKGYEIIFPQCTCPCGGHLRKDADYVVPCADDPMDTGKNRAAAAAISKQKTKNKQNQLPKLVVEQHKDPIGKTLPGIQSKGPKKIQSLPQSNKLTNITNRFTDLWTGGSIHTTDYGWSEFEPPATPPSSRWTSNSLTNGSSMNRSPAAKSYIVKPFINNEEDLIQLLQELLKTTGVPLKVTDGRILALFAQADARLITKIQSDECGGILNWAKPKKQFYIDNDFIDLTERAPATKPKFQPSLKPKIDSSLSHNGWQVALGRRTTKAMSFSLADLDDFQLASFDSGSSSSYEESLSSNKSPMKNDRLSLDIGASGDVRRNVGWSATDNDGSNEELYQDLMAFDFNAKFQEMYGEFLTCSQSIEVTYAYGHLAKEVEKLCDSIKK